MKTVIFISLFLFSYICYPDINEKKMQEDALEMYLSENYASAFQLYEKLSRTGNPIAEFYLGIMYLEGFGVNKNKLKAMEYFNKSANQNNSDAQFNLYLMYDKGETEYPDKNKALFWLIKSAENGNSKAQNNLGTLLLEGKEIKKDYKRAFELFTQASSTSIEAQLSLGHMYFHGKGVKQDYKNAFYWYEKAADNNSSTGQFECGVMSFYGKGTEQSYETALKWFLKANKNGNRLAGCYLVVLLSKEHKKYNKDKQEKALELVISKLKNADDFNSAALILSENNTAVDEALKLVQLSIKEKPDCSNYITTLAYVYYKQQKYKEAIEEAQKALLLNSNCYKVHILLGDTYEAVGEIDNAKKEWRLALENADENNFIVEKIKDVLNKDEKYPNKY